MFCHHRLLCIMKASKESLFFVFHFRDAIVTSKEGISFFFVQQGNGYVCAVFFLFKVLFYA